MKILALVVSLMLLAACGPAFTASPFTETSAAGAIGVAPAGASSAAGSGAIALSGGGGAAGAIESAAGAAGAADPSAAGAAGARDPATLYTPVGCSGERTVTGGYDALSSASSCLRTREAFNTVACTNWDGRSIAINGVPAACGVPAVFPESVDGYTYLDLGAGTAGDAAVRWFLTTPSQKACSAREWAQGDLYFPGEIIVGTCDFPGSSKACELGKSYAFSCTDSAAHCSSIGPGASGWISAWTLITICR